MDIIKPLKIGDVVKLKGAFLRLTIVSLFPKVAVDTAEVAWFTDTNQVASTYFPLDALEKVGE